MPINILAVDDNERVCKVVKEYLTKMLDCEVTVCLDGYHALKHLDDKQPDLDVVILDIMMRTHGGAVAEQLRRMPRYRNVLLIFYTALKAHQVEKRFVRGAYVVHKGEGALEKLAEIIQKEMKKREKNPPKQPGDWR
jgi:CheY-like chemotaxis protein